MFENMGTMFNGMFGKIQSGMCRLSINGDIAVKTSNGYKTYNLKKGTLTNVTSFCFNIGEEFFFLMPTNKVSSGDIILVDGKPKCVVKCDGKVITAIDYESSEIRQILPERHVFMGSTYFYGKIVSMFGNTKFLKSQKGVGKMMQMMMLSSMMNGKSEDSNGMSNIMPMMMMMNGGNGFADMFDGMFDFSADNSDEEVTEETEEVEE
jgi:hypothetical protein